MVTVFLCDDNKKTLTAYSKLIAEIAKKHRIQVSISNFESGNSLIFHLSDSPDLADIIYLDVIMDSLNGIDTAKELRKLGCKAEIIFLTTSEDYVFDAFDISPVQYLVKESTLYEKFEEVFLRAVSLIEYKESEMFVCEARNISKAIPIKDIFYFEVQIRVVIVHYSNGESFKFYSTMEKIENQLENKNFIRVHRAYLVNLKYIRKFQPRNLTLKSGDEIPVGATYAKNVKEAFSNYITKFNINN